MDAAFEFFSKLGTPFFCFHDRDIAPDGVDYRETVGNLHTMVDYAAEKMEETGVKLLWGTANLFSHPRFAASSGRPRKERDRPSPAAMNPTPTRIMRLLPKRALTKPAGRLNPAGNSVDNSRRLSPQQAMVTLEPAFHPEPE